MKTVKSIAVIASLIILSVLLSDCGGSKGTTPSPQDQAKTLMTSSVWKLQSSTVDGVDQTSLYKNFTISFTSSGFTTTNGGAIWPASGTWSFQGTSVTPITVVRNDGLQVQIDVTSSTLVMTLAWTQTTLGPGRVQSTSGQNVFNMIH